jgi:large subunit ribosomal protein L25
MADVRLVAESRTDRGSARAGRLRKTGRIPAIVYGHGSDPIAVTVDGRELRTALSGDAGLNALLDLQVDGDSLTALARELQRHPVRGTVQHVDFQIVDRNQAITVDVPVEIIGEAHEVSVQGGVVVLDVVSLTVNATPATIPQVIEIETSHLEIGQVIRLGEITLPNGVTCDADPETVMVTALIPRVVEEVEEVAEGEEGAEGAEGEAAEGGAAASEGGGGEAAATESSDGE